MRVLVTGIAGFIGSNLARRLAAEGCRVTGVDDLSTGRRRNLEGLDVPLLEGDIRDPAVCAAACADVDAIVHLAARNSVPRSLADPESALAVNITGTLHLLQAGRAARIRRVVYASSSSVYGDDPTQPRREDLAPAPISPYAATKVATEALARSWSASFGVPTVGLRFFNVFGPRQDPDSPYSAVIPRFVRAALRGEPATVHGDGSTSRDFTYVDNVLDGIGAALAAPPRAEGRVYNLACGRAVSLTELHAAIATAAAGSSRAARPVAPVFVERRPGDQDHSLADIRAARADLGYTPRVPFEEGIRRTVAWFATEEP